MTPPPPEVVELVEESRTTQGLPRRVEDPSTLHRVARLLAGRDTTPVATRGRVQASDGCTSNGRRPDA